MLMKTINRTRILAVEIRADRLGYAVFESPEQLLDFGSAWFDSMSVARSRIVKLLGRVRPSLIVLRQVRPHGPRRMAAWHALTRMMRDEAKKRSIAIGCVTEKAFVEFFIRYSCQSKYDIAALLATWFPETAWRLTAKREIYAPEPRAMLYFDSVALGIAYLRLVMTGPIFCTKWSVSVTPLLTFVRSRRRGCGDVGNGFGFPHLHAPVLE